MFTVNFLLETSFPRYSNLLEALLKIYMADLVKSSPEFTGILSKISYDSFTPSREISIIFPCNLRELSSPGFFESVTSETIIVEESGLYED